ncbi:MAG: hypothetical protein NTW26_06175 [bacterium]|nr:hypothetical protein [bacterium]
MFRLTARLRRVIQRRLFKDEQKRKRITTPLSILPAALVIGYMCFIMLETLWVAVWTVGAGLLISIFVYARVFSDRALAVSLLYQEIEEHWRAFNERIGKNPTGPRFKTVIAGYETIAKRFKEIDTKPGELKPLVDEVYSVAVALAGEWLRQDKVYQFYERARDIDSKPLVDKAWRLITNLVERTNDFAGLVDRLAEAVNRLEAFELESEVAKEFGTAGSGTAVDLSPITALVDDLRDWSKCLTATQEEFDREKL